ncbi:hypothetical protein ABE36_13590 [Bacillus subtilis]|nr:hypothetical protein AWV81_20785 [Bacillus subtilis subsp. natto]API44118.1 hypothetical protein BSR08_17190 [Bacillus subtilis]BAI87579.1 hypothetical protein BSNT_10571 [Bacillus subtilis subsp. natto BEST195]GAK81301.1 hypothetical protein BSMD_032160 [Bacillus subtilis Miyagi-4]API96781.1 hypothetical protein BKP58_13550 [Bacillus subtilis]
MAEESSEKRSFPFLIGIVGPCFSYIWKGDGNSRCGQVYVNAF